MTELGRTNAPMAELLIEGLEGEPGFVVITTFAKWVGTEMLGGDPMTS